MRYLSNPQPGAVPPDHPMLDANAARAVVALLRECFDYRPTPLVDLRGIAEREGLAMVSIKDEGARLGLKSFKALGGAYAVFRLVLAEASRRLNRNVTADELPRAASGSLALPAHGTADRPGHSAVAAIAAGMTFACATDGNHGQSVAAGARLVGARAIIFVHEGVSAERREAIARFGAEIHEVPGSYDDAVAESKHQCEIHGWTLLSDTSWPGYTTAPALVMQGYTAMTHELHSQLGAAPTHVFLQAGVGGFAAALATSLASVFEPAPRVVIVEPTRAACLLASAEAGTAVRIDADAPTAMAMLECYEPSLLAWDLLQPMATAFMAVDDEDAVAAMRRLARPLKDAEVVVAGESGSAGLAGLLAACGAPDIKTALGLDETARVLLINTEGATDEARYAAAVGQSAAEVAARIPASRFDTL
ncbi:diaminopropionate ammonia-lyase [Rhodoferax koreense]|uniref:Diaminopropionate ammonia-lyase n=1 Tax=Rhodoferax koreensis TaxID=1842727 RepID=A0A1P8JXS8_9BURK|nr:diaminopropionate ammonia-lyase [Rhodoferax koreense]APW38501.1 diaminopropionate ammonia-lyase [Rhodoferax koreense]